MKTAPRADSTARGAAFTLIGGLLTMGINVKLASFVAKTLGPTQKGSYDVMMATTAIATVAFSFCLYTGVTYAVAKNPQASTRRLAFQLLGFAVGQSLLAFIVLLLAAHSPARSAVIPAGLTRFAPIAIAVGVLIAILIAYLRAFLSGWRRLVTLTYLDVGYRILMLGTAMFLLHRLAGSQIQLDKVAYGSTLVAGTVIGAVLFGLVLPMTRHEGEALPIRDITTYSFANLAGAAVQEVNFRLGTFMLLYYTTPHDVGLYTTALQTSQLLWMPAVAMQAAVFPRFAGIHEPEHRRQVYARAMRVNGTVAVAGGVVFLLIGKWLMAKLYGPAFSESTPLALWIAPSIVLFAVLNNVSSAYNAALGKPQLNGIGAAIGLVLFVVVGLVAIPRLGVLGGVIGASASYIGTASYVFMKANQHAKLGSSDLFQLRRGDFDEVERVLKRVLTPLFRRRAD